MEDLDTRNTQENMRTTEKDIFFFFDKGNIVTTRYPSRIIDAHNRKK
jgi:hypothetical protein